MFILTILTFLILLVYFLGMTFVIYYTHALTFIPLFTTTTKKLDSIPCSMKFLLCPLTQIEINNVEDTIKAIMTFKRQRRTKMTANTAMPMLLTSYNMKCVYRNMAMSDLL